MIVGCEKKLPATVILQFIHKHMLCIVSLLRMLCFVNNLEMWSVNMSVIIIRFRSASASVPGASNKLGD